MQLVVTLPQSSKLPLYKQISDALRDAVVSGRIAPGKRMPSTRELETELRVSRLTICRAIEDLASQGYVKTVVGSGSFVNKGIWQEKRDFSPAASGDQRAALTIDCDTTSMSAFAERVSQLCTKTSVYDSFCKANQDNSQLPLEAWARMLHKSMRIEQLSKNRVIDTEISNPNQTHLKEAIAAFVGRARSIKCDPEQVVIFPSLNSGIDLILRLLANEGDTIAVENPGPIDFRETVQLQGKHLFPVPIDDQGMIVSELDNSIEKLKLAYVTPSHQVPSGVTMSKERRLELLEWAKRTKAWIIEDDADCEYRYGERAIQAIASYDDNDRVIYKSSFKSALYPLIRFSFAVLPRQLVSIVSKANCLTEGESPELESHALTRLIIEGHLERHIRRSHSVYSIRRAATIHALTKYLRNSVTIARQSGGLHLIVQLADHLQADLISSCAKQCGIPLVSTSPFYVFGSPRNQYMLGFAYSNEKEIESNIIEFAAALNAPATEPVPKEMNVDSAQAVGVDMFVAHTPDTQEQLSGIVSNHFE
jgi:GntR family transcriptional regulator / MocR family aminotransferase